jgi:DNA invertase Pin-like site-specific DNA recombinase
MGSVQRLRIMPLRRAALYLRVSTDRHETACQRPEVEQLARTRGFEVVKVFEEKMSAAKVRPEYARMAAPTSTRLRRATFAAPLCRRARMIKG